MDWAGLQTITEAERQRRRRRLRITNKPPGAVSGVAFSWTPIAAGGKGALAVTLATGTLPTGLSFSGGAVTGTPSQTGTFPIWLRITDGRDVFADRPTTIVVNAA